MQSLIKKTEQGLLKFTSFDAVSGNMLAEKLEIPHKNIMRTIKKVIMCEKDRKSHSSDVSREIIHIAEENELNFNAVFKKWEYKTARGRTYTTFIMNEDALYLVIANSQSAKAHELKVWFKSEFNKMRQERNERSTSKQLSRPMTNQVKRLRVKLFEEKSGSAPFIYAIIAKQIYKAITGRPMPKGGIDHDALSIEENHEIAKIRVETELMIKDMLDSGKTAYHARNAVEIHIKSYTMRKGNEHEYYTR